MSVICRAIRRASVRAGVAGLLLLASLAAMQPVSAAAVVLRYHYAAGQNYGYRATMTIKMALDMGANLPNTTSKIVESTTTRYHVLSVDASGGATVRITTSPTTVHITSNGQTQTTTATTQTVTLHMSANGNATMAHSSGTFTLNAQSFGALPSGPVAPGAHWSSTSLFSLGAGGILSIPPTHLTTHTTFSGYAQSSGQQAAVLNAIASPQINAKLTLQGHPMRMHMSGQITTHRLFGLRDRRFLTSTIHEDMKLAMQSAASGATSSAIHEHVVLDTTQQPL